MVLIGPAAETGECLFAHHARAIGTRSHCAFLSCRVFFAQPVCHGRNALMRHHYPARWPPDYGIARPTPDEFVQPRVAVGAHHQKIDRVGLHIGFEDFADRTAIDLDRFEYRRNSVLGEMACKRGPGFKFRRCFLVDCSNDAHIRGRLKELCVLYDR